MGVMIGLYVLLEWLTIWVTHQLNKNKGAAVIEYRDGKQHRYSFATIQQAAAFTIKCKAKGKSVAYIEVDGKTVWHEQKDLKSLVELAKE